MSHFSASSLLGTDMTGTHTGGKAAKAKAKAGKRAKKAAGEIRHYVVVKSSQGGTAGYYSSKSGPAAAAKKAANRRFTASSTTLTLTLRETGTDREFSYRLTRKKLPKPYVSTIAGKEIKRLYTTEVKAL
jgi:hypothetical protein